MEGLIARWYDRNRQLESDHRRLLTRLDSLLPHNAAVLEVACGPGHLSIALAQAHPDYRVMGLDISHTFIQLANQHATDAGVTVSFVHGNAAALPFDNGSFDCIVCVAAFKNFSEPVQAIQEMYRVLKPGGSAIILDLHRDASMADIRAYVDKTSMGFVSRHFTLWVFRWFLCKKAYSSEEMRQMVTETEFKSCLLEQADISLEVTLTKHGMPLPPSAVGSGDAEIGDSNTAQGSART
jgi:ubiquinone/menaquinone biosynthesis C-methylase UbiE